VVNVDPFGAMNTEFECIVDARLEFEHSLRRCKSHKERLLSRVLWLLGGLCIALCFELGGSCGERRVGFIDF